MRLRRQVAAVNLLPGYSATAALRCRKSAAAKLLPPNCLLELLPAARSLRRLSGFGSLSLCKSVVELLHRDAILLKSLGDAAVGEQ